MSFFEFSHFLIFNTLLATLKQVQSNQILVQLRKQQVEERKKIYVWLMFRESGVPSGIDITTAPPPLDEKFDKGNDQSYYKILAFGSQNGNFDLAKKLLSAALGRSIDECDTVNSLHAYYELAKSIERAGSKATPGEDCKVEESLVAYEGNRWISDVEFGRQILNGVNCVLIERCTELPYNFPVTNQMVKNVLCRGMSLQMEMEVIFCSLMTFLQFIFIYFRVIYSANISSKVYSNRYILLIIII